MMIEIIDSKHQTPNKKYFRLLSKGKVAGKAVTAVARELAGFIWAITQEIENNPKVSKVNN